MKRRLIVTALSAGAVLVAMALPAAAGAATHHATPDTRSHWSIPAVIGRVSAVDTTSFTVTGFGGATFTVNTSGTTAFELWGSSTASFSSVAVGDMALVDGTDSANVVTATNVVLFAPGNFVVTHQKRVFGDVTGVSATGFTMVSRHGVTVTVTTSPTTVLKEAGVTSPAVAVGDFVAVDGALSGTAISATTVRIFTPRPAPAPVVNHVIGGVTAISATGFTVTSRHGVSITVTTTPATVTTENGVSSPVVAVGDFVALTGTLSGSAMTASTVFIFNLTPVTHVHSYFGSVSAVGATGFTMTDRHGATITVTTSATTVVAEHGVASPVVAVGNFVAVLGTGNGTNLAATAVQIFNPVDNQWAGAWSALHGKKSGH